jgi:hypothetical protein
MLLTRGSGGTIHAQELQYYVSSMGLRAACSRHFGLWHPDSYGLVITVNPSLLFLRYRRGFGYGLARMRTTSWR